MWAEALSPWHKPHWPVRLHLKHKFKDEIIKHFKMVTTEHENVNKGPFWAQGLVELHYLHTHEASSGDTWSLLLFCKRNYPHTFISTLLMKSCFMNSLVLGQRLPWQIKTKRDWSPCLGPCQLRKQNSSKAALLEGDSDFSINKQWGKRWPWEHSPIGSMRTFWVSNHASDQSQLEDLETARWPTLGFPIVWHALWGTC